MPLNAFEIDKNVTEASNLVVGLGQVSDQKKDAIWSLIMDFTSREGITLPDLRLQEQVSLISILKQHVLQQTDISLNNQLISDLLLGWKNGLDKAAAGQGAIKRLYDSQPMSGMAACLRQLGRVPDRFQGTDEDVIDALGNKITAVEDIVASGTYILGPQSLSVADYTHYRDQLADVQNQIKNNVSDGPVKILTPISCGSRHWRLAKVSFNESGDITNALLWGPLSSEANNGAFNEFSTTVKEFQGSVDASLVSGDVQSNSWSCLDNCLAEALSDIGETDHAIVMAATPEARRAETIQTIADNKGIQLAVMPAPELEQTNAQGTVTNIDADTASDEQLQQAVEQWLTAKNTSRNVQVHFDELYAGYLQNQGDGKAADHQARLSALKQYEALNKYSLFAEQATAGDDDSADDDALTSIPVTFDF